MVGLGVPGRYVSVGFLRLQYPLLYPDAQCIFIFTYKTVFGFWVGKYTSPIEHLGSDRVYFRPMIGIPTKQYNRITSNINHQAADQVTSSFIKQT